MNTADWDAYLGNFHATLPGITEEVLAACHDGPISPYGWLTDGLGEDDSVLDVGCGSGPAYLDTMHRWVGIDRPVDELRAAHALGRTSVAPADATRSPTATVSVDVVTEVDPVGWTVRGDW